MSKMEFWFEFGSTYSYFSIMRIGDLAEKAGVDVTWRPFLLGPIFKQFGWDTSPFNIYKQKGAYMWRDMERQAEAYGLPYNKPDEAKFPQNGLHAARIAMVGLQEGWGIEFCRKVFTAQYVEGCDIADAGLLKELVLKSGGQETDLAAAQIPENKEALKSNVQEAIDKNIFGAPSFMVGDELFWGDDRLEQALNWACK